MNRRWFFASLLALLGCRMPDSATVTGYRLTRIKSIEFVPGWVPIDFDWRKVWPDGGQVIGFEKTYNVKKHLGMLNKDSLGYNGMVVTGYSARWKRKFNWWEITYTLMPKDAKRST